MPVEAPDPISAVLFMMEQKALSRRDLNPAIGTRTRVAEVLNRRARRVNIWPEPTNGSFL
jgi:HTH-type transcriptional regulator/antitoxin HigA